MKKRNVLLALLLSLIAFNACKNFSSSKDDGSTKLLDNDDDKKANEIIAFNNGFLQISKSYSSYINQFERYFTSVNNSIKAASEGNDYLIPPMLPISVSVVTYKTPKKVPDAFGDAQKEMQKDFEIVNNNYKSIKESADSLDKYFRAEDFKDDKGARSRSIQENASKLATEYFEAYARIMKTMQPYADDAEVIVLKDHPLKEQILSSKKVLMLVETYLDEVDKQVVAKTYNEAELQKKYNDIEAAAQKNAVLKIEERSNDYKFRKTRFEEFNKSADGFLGAARKFMRDRKENKNDQSDPLREINNAYDKVLSSYNYFVD